ncbi:MAG TPA: hypothetical protein VF779_15730 [Pyrinomonadaceae bacterium]
MDLMDELNGLLKQYTGTQPDNAPGTVHDDFDQVAQAAPQPAVADGLAEAFRSDQTPEFGQMTAKLFNNSNPQQQAGLLNTILKYAGPAILSHLTGGGGAGSSSSAGSGGGGLSDLINIFKGGGQQEVTPEQAQQIPPETVEQIAAQAQQHDPSIIDRVSDFYAAHPTLVKTLGTAALTIMLSRIAKSQFG